MKETKLTVVKEKKDFLEYIGIDASLKFIQPDVVWRNREHRESALQTLGELLDIEPLYFEDIFTEKSLINTTNFEFKRVPNDKDFWLNGRAHPSTRVVRYGHTRVHDQVNILWERRSVYDYFHDDNGFPKIIKNLLLKLEKLNLPFGIAITIWTPAQFPSVSDSVQADPMLVFEVNRHICLALARWNPTI